MRTTVDLPDELVTLARRRAADEGTTLTALLARRVAPRDSPARRRRSQRNARFPRCLATAAGMQPWIDPGSQRIAAGWRRRRQCCCLTSTSCWQALRPDHVHHRPALRVSGQHAVEHEHACRQRCRAGLRWYGLPTNPRVFVQPDTIGDVLDYIDALLDPPVEIIRAGPGHWPRFAGLCRDLNLRGNLVPDAYLVALAFEQRAELVTFDPRVRALPAAALGALPARRLKRVAIPAAPIQRTPS